MRTVDNHLLVLSPRLSLTLALSQTYAHFIAPPKDEAPPLRESRHLPLWQRGLITLIHRRIVSELWRERSQLSSPAQDSQVRSRWPHLASFITRNITGPAGNAGPAPRIGGPFAFDLRVPSAAGGGIVALAGRASVEALTDLRVAGRRGSYQHPGDPPAPARPRLAPRTLRTAAFRSADDSQSATLMSKSGLRIQDLLVWPEGLQRAHRGSGPHNPDQRQATRTVSAVPLAYRAPKTTAPAETIAAPAVVRERTASPAIDMNKLERDLWRQMERRVRIERERRGRQ